MVCTCCQLCQALWKSLRSRALLRGLKISGARVGPLALLTSPPGTHLMALGRSSKNYKTDVNAVQSEPRERPGGWEVAVVMGSQQAGVPMLYKGSWPFAAA